MRFIFTFIFLSIVAAGCKNGNRPDVRKRVEEIHIERLDRDLFALDTLYPDVEVLRKKYGRYLDIYSYGVLNLGLPESEQFPELLTLFLRDPVMRELADFVAQAYPDLHEQEKWLSLAWAYFDYYFPGRERPRIYAHISGFNQSVIVDSAAVGISLDNYLGEQCVFYSMLAVPIPFYARKKMTGEDIPRDVLTAWLSTEFPFRPQEQDLISGMIYQGKLAYVLQQLFPDKPLCWSLGFTPEQQQWCRDNERQIWSFLIENELLFSTQQKVLMKYLNDAPFTSGMPTESPGRAVVWTGLQIVKKYEEKKGISLPDLMEEQDYRQILRSAGYRP